MALNTQIEIRHLESMTSGTTEFYTPQSSHETMLVQVRSRAVEDLFVHRFQTDQLLVVRGSFVLVVFQNRQYQYIPLSDRCGKVVTIPPGVVHSAINLNDEPCLMVNAVLRHGSPHPKDYRPLKPPIPYDLTAARSALDRLNLTAIG